MTQRPASESAPERPEDALRMAAEWVRAKPDEWCGGDEGKVYRRGRWLATFCDDAGQPDVLAVSAYRYNQLAIEQFNAILRTPA